VERPGPVRYCEQRTDIPVDGLREFLLSKDGESRRLRGKLGLGADWADRWETLSHGERKRAQIAIALRENPTILVLDEPTNHVDGEARDLIAAALNSFRGIGLLVSHDRDLLDSLCRRCLFLEPPIATVYAGNYTECSRRKYEEEQYLRERRRLADEEMNRLDREAIRRRQEADRDSRSHSGRGIPPKDHDARAKLRGARLTGKDAVRGKLAKQLDGRRRQAEKRRDDAPVVKETITGIRLDTARSRRDVLFRFEAGALPLGPVRILRFPALAMFPEDRIALTGPNGTGKSTLLEYILRSLNIPAERALFIPQEIPPETGQESVRRARMLSGRALGDVMTVVSRLGSSPERLLQTDDPSPGETRKLLLALGMTDEPHLIVMDEPTNHMDLVSVECLEKALECCSCGLLLVSHDLRFLRNLTGIRWNIRRLPEESVLDTGGWE
jgi:ATPase subunit of ABC transporter with duplicated ATPase domains